MTKKLFFILAFLLIGALATAHFGCSGQEAKETVEQINGPLVPNFSGESGCLTDNPVSYQNCWAYATMRMMYAKGQHCSFGYKQDIQSMSNPCIELEWSGDWSNSSHQADFFSKVSFGDAISLGGANTHIVYVVGTGSTLNSIVVDDANRFGSGQIQHNTTLQQIKNANSTYVPTHLWKYTGPVSTPCPIPPDAPELLTPNNNQQVGLDELAFDWNDTWTPTTLQNYRIQISTSSNFSTTVIDQTTGTESIIYYITLPTGGTTYYWRVNATNTNATSEWSQVRSVWTLPVINQITMPTEGGIYSADVSLEMQWSVNAPLSSLVKVYFSSNGGSSWTWKADVPYSAGANGNTYMLQNPGIVSTNAKLKLVDNTHSSVYKISAPFITGPAVTISGPTSRANFQNGTWTVSTNPTGSYTYKWYRKNYNSGGNYVFVGTGANYTGAPNGGWFALKAEVYSGSIKIGESGVYVSCSDCGGPEI